MEWMQASKHLHQKRCVNGLVLQLWSSIFAKGENSESNNPLIVDASKHQDWQESTHLLQLRDIRNVVISSFSLLFLQLDGDTSDGASLQTLHQVSDEPGNLILKIKIMLLLRIAFIRVLLHEHEDPISYRNQLKHDKNKLYKARM